MRKAANGFGSVYKLSGRRTHPWTARKTVGYNEKGHPKYKFIGFYKTRSEAVNALTAYNKSPYSLDGERVCDMYEGFIAGYSQNHNEKTVHNIEIAYNHMEPIQKEPIATLSRKKLQTYFDSLAVSQQVKQKIKSALKMIMNYAIRYDVIQPERIVILDYIDLTSSTPVKKVERKVFTPEEIKKLTQINDEMSNVILFLIYTGLRAGEFCHLDDKSIDDDMVIHIGKSKTAAGVRDIPLSDKAQKLAPVPHFDDYYNLKYYFTAWREKHGFDHTLHDTRHTCASLLANAGVDKRIVQAILGHKGKDVTDKVYTHISIDVMREALNKI